MSDHSDTADSRWGIPVEDTVIVLRAVITQYEDDSIEIYKRVWWLSNQG